MILVYPQVGDEIGFHTLKLHYFDRLLRDNVTCVAVCDTAVMSQKAVSPLVACKATLITVKLPRGTKLRKVKELGKDQLVGSMHKSPPPTVAGNHPHHQKWQL